MTNEGKSLTEKFMDANGAKYAFAYDKGGKLQRSLGVGGIPHAFLLDPTGVIVWEGHPGSLTKSTVSKALEGAISKPVWEWPSEAKGVGKAFSSRKFGEALEAALKLGESGQEYATAIKTLAGKLAAKVTKAREEGDWLTVDEKGNEYVGQLRGLEVAADVEAALEALKSDKQAQEILKAQKQVQKILGGKIKGKDLPKVKDKLRKIAADFPGTAVERDVNTGIDRLTDR